LLFQPGFFLCRKSEPIQEELYRWAKSRMKTKNPGLTSRGFMF
jgi:hypothetical protein